MKKMILSALAILAISPLARAEKVDTEECNQEILVKALSKRMKGLPSEMLLSTSFSIKEVKEATNRPGYDYIVTVDMTSKADQSVTSSAIGVKVKNAAECKVDTDIVL